MRKSRLNQYKQDCLIEHFIAGKIPVFGLLKHGGMDASMINRLKELEAKIDSELLKEILQKKW